MPHLQNLLKTQIGWLNSKGKSCEGILSSSIPMARNLANGKFTHASNPKELNAVKAQLFTAAKRCKSLNGAAYIAIDGIEALDRRFLVERHLISADLIARTQERALIVAHEETTSIMINEEDHVRLQVIMPGMAAAQALETAVTMDEEIASAAPYACRPDFGYLTTCPTNVGTGLRVSCLVHLPGLVQTKNISKILQELSRIGFVARGFYGEGSKAFGNLFQISNATSLGRPESEYVHMMTGIMSSMLSNEDATRDEMVKEMGRLRFEDRVGRALGTLGHAQLLSYEEAMEEISWLRLGLTREVKLEGVTLGKLNDLLINAQPAHIEMSIGHEAPPIKRDELRAALSRKTLHA